MATRKNLRTVDKPGETNPTGRDAWLDQDDGYSPEVFYTGSKDAQGHSTYVRIRVADHVYAQAVIMIASREVPELRTLPDLFRDAIHHRMRYIAQTRGTRQVTKLAQVIALQDQVESRSRMYEQIDELLETTSNTVRRMAKFDDRDEINQLLQELNDGLARILSKADYKRIKPKLESKIQRMMMDIDAGTTLS